MKSAGPVTPTASIQSDAIRREHGHSNLLILLLCRSQVTLQTARINSSLTATSMT